MKILEKTTEGVFKIEKPAIKVVEREYTIKRVKKKIAKLTQEIASKDSLIAKRDELETILGLMQEYNG